MVPSPSVQARPGGRVVALLVVVLVLVAGCSDDQAADPAPSSPAPTTATPTTAPGNAPTPRATSDEALRALLEAEQRGDHATSFRLLNSNARREYRDLADWVNRRNERPPITGFTIEPATGPDRPAAIVEHEPGLDPFIGLSPAKERQSWTAVQEGDGWLLDADPDVTYLLPPDDDAAAVAVEWASAVQACDQERAAQLQAVPDLFGSSQNAQPLCGSTGAPVAGPVANLPAGPVSADIVAQYSTDALDWARAVPISGPTPNFFVVLAPIGDMWKIVGLYD